MTDCTRGRSVSGQDLRCIEERKRNLNARTAHLLGSSFVSCDFAFPLFLRCRSFLSQPAWASRLL